MDRPPGTEFVAGKSLEHAGRGHGAGWRCAGGTRGAGEGEEKETGRGRVRAPRRGVWRCECKRREESEGEAREDGGRASERNGERKTRRAERASWKKGGRARAGSPGERATSPRARERARTQSQGALAGEREEDRGGGEKKRRWERIKSANRCEEIREGIREDAWKETVEKVHTKA